MKSYIFDSTCSTNFNKENTSLKHANQFAVLLVLSHYIYKYWFWWFKTKWFWYQCPITL